MTHPRQQLSALIDGELDLSERERVLTHVFGCAACREEVAALRMLKRKLNALADTAAGAALAGLTGRLMEQLSQLGPDQPRPGGAEAPSGAGWPAGSAQDWRFPSQGGKSGQRGGKYFLAGSLVIFMAGLGTAAFIAGGEPQPSAPAAPAPPSVDVMVVPHDALNVSAPANRPQPRRTTPGLFASSLLAQHS